MSLAVELVKQLNEGEFILSKKERIRSRKESRYFYNHYTFNLFRFQALFLMRYTSFISLPLKFSVTVKYS